MKLNLATYLLLLVVCFIPAQVSSYAYEYLEVNQSVGTEKMQSLGEYVYLERVHTRVLDTVVAIHSNYPLFLRLRNVSNEPISRVVSFGKPHVFVNGVRVVNEGDTTHQTGWLNSVTLTLLPNTTSTLFFEVKEINRFDTQFRSLALFSPELYNRQITALNGPQIFFLGLFAFILLIALAGFIVNKEKDYLKYALYISLALLYFTYYCGYMQWALPFVKTSSHNFLSNWYSLIFISYFFFVNAFGRYKIHSPLAHTLLNFGIVFKLIQSFIDSFLYSMGWQFMFSNAYKYTIMGFELVLMAAIVYAVLKNKHLRGRIVLYASLFLIVGGVLNQIIEGGVLVMEFAMTLELLTFTIGLGYFSKQIIKEKEEHRVLYQQHLSTQQLLNDKLKQQFDQLNSRKHAAEEKYIKDGAQHRKIKSDDVLYLKAGGSYCHIYTVGQRAITLSMNLQHALQHLEFNDMVRVHRSYAINQKHIESFNSKHIHVNGEQIPIGKNYQTVVSGLLPNK